MKDAYVYVYLDPTKTAIRQTNILTLLYEPFYVGKGTGDRWDFSKRMYDDENYFLRKKLKELKSKNINPYVLMLPCDSENDAYALEFQLTSFLGIYPSNDMCNLRYGGLGGFTLSEYTKNLLKQLNSGENNPNYGTTWTEERRTKLQSTWDKKRELGLTKKTPDEMKHVWDQMRRKYKIISTDGAEYETEDLTKFCKLHGLPLSAIRTALKSPDNTVTSKLGKGVKSRAEGYKVFYID